MDYLGITDIPEKHIVKRWARNARDVLPVHLRHYQLDQVAGNSFTYRHSNLYMQAMEIVRLGDTSAEAYEKLTAMFKDVLATMAPFEENRDGLALEDRPLLINRKQIQEQFEGSGDN